MKRQYLHRGWILKNSRVGALPATVPGCVHTDLIDNGILRDLFWRDTPQSALWIEECEWTYQLTFDYHGELPATLVFEGLDTYADVTLNGVPVGSTDDMFIPHRFDVSSHIKPTDNLLSVRFRSPIKEVSDLPLAEGAFTRERMNTRRIQCTYGWDWVDRFVTSGIYRDVYLEYANGIDVEDVYVYTESIDAFSAQIVTTLRFKEFTSPAMATVEILSPTGEVVESARFWADGETFVRRFDIPSPLLWYPNGYGAQPLYLLRIRVGENLHEERFGIRILKILQLPDAEGSEYAAKAQALQALEGGQKYDRNETYSGFSVIVNGRQIFCRGGNWVPCEPFPSAESDEKIETLVKMAKDMGANFLRVWGGGLFEKKAFYNACDQYGILVAQDFLMACGTYPEKEEWFIGALRKEAEFAAKYLRNHPSLAWWHGDNENATRGSDTQEDYRGRDSALRGIAPMLQRYDYTRPLLPSSPYGGETYASITKGTSHTSNFLNITFKHFDESDCSDYKEFFGHFLSRFICEEPTFGAAITPSLLKFLTEDDLYSDESQEMLIYHSKTNPALKKHLYDYVATFTEKLLGAFRDGEDRLFKYQYVQYEWVRATFENVRRNLGYCNGLLYWMFNDCWPAALGWSLVDYYSCPKPSYYAFARAAKPIIGSIAEEEGVLKLFLSSDGSLREEVHITAHFMRNGRVADTYASNLKITDYGAIKLPLPWKCDGDTLLVCDLTYTSAFDRCFYKAGALPLVPCDDLLEITEKTEESITLRAKGYVHCVALEGDPTLEDNYFSMMEGETRALRLKKGTAPFLRIKAYTVSFH